MSRLLFALVTMLAAASATDAHFVFVVPQPGGATATVVMSEDLTVDEDIDIEIIGGAKLFARSTAGEEKPLTLRKSGKAYAVDIPEKGTRVIHGTCDLGVSRRGNSAPFLLVYHPKTILGDPFDPKSALGDAAPAEIVAIGKAGAVKFEVLVAAAPQPDIEINVILPDGSHKKVKTGKDGQSESFPSVGRYGAWAHYVEKRAGERGGEKYDEIRHYPTFVADIRAAAADAVPAASHYGSLPETASSFGAAVSDGWLYVYGGHITPTHVYSTQAVSGRFHRLNLADGKTWEELPGGPGLQGLNIATYDGKIYRVGGMQPRNAPKEKSDNISLADCLRFDPSTRKWETIAPLPEPRSSHDVAVVDGKLFAVGGWTMNGPKGNDWLQTMAMLDLKADRPVWRSIKQPFQRRAMVAASFQGKLYVIGGFTDDDEATLDVEIYDPATDKWTKGTPLPRPGGNGFAPAACAVGDNLYVSVADGSLYRFSGADMNWTKIATSTPRIVHRMVSAGSQLLLLGGASKGDTLNLIESVRIDRH